LDRIDGVFYEKNRAAFYLFPGIDRERFDFKSGQDFAMRFLHECRVLVIPGTGFDWNEDIRFRIVMLPEAEVLTKAMEDLKGFLDRHRK
ncbi:MAG: aminotransferase, partial [Clostridia bacterium]|nr:aminotransferase [Clostridia bacterium]